MIEHDDKKKIAIINVTSEKDVVRALNRNPLVTLNVANEQARNVLIDFRGVPVRYKYHLRRNNPAFMKK